MSLVFHFTRAATKAFPAGELSIYGDLSSVEPSLLIAEVDGVQEVDGVASCIASYMIE
ncbi:hypothetical protein AAG906_039711 [Vitis piasezkii]